MFTWSQRVSEYKQNILVEIIKLDYSWVSAEVKYDITAHMQL